MAKKTKKTQRVLCFINDENKGKHYDDRMMAEMSDRIEDQKAKIDSHKRRAAELMGVSLQDYHRMLYMQLFTTAKIANQGDLDKMRFALDHGDEMAPLSTIARALIGQFVSEG